MKIELVDITQSNGMHSYINDKMQKCLHVSR